MPGICRIIYAMSDLNIVPFEFQEVLRFVYSSH